MVFSFTCGSSLQQGFPAHVHDEIAYMYVYMYSMCLLL